jgi:ferredoxin
MTILYFTATGNSLYVAKQLGGKLLSIPHCLKQQQYFIKDDVVGIVIPVYALSVPKIVQTFLDKIKIEAEYKFLIGTYGGLAVNFLTHTNKQYEHIGFNYLNQVKMVDNYVSATNTQREIENAPKKHIDEKITRIKQDIDARKIRTKLRFKFMTPLAFLIRKINLDKNKVYIDTNQCNKCGMCTKVCPCSNITLQGEAFPTFGNNCTNCLACLHHCPQKAIHLKGEKSNVHFINEDVTLQEIIEANSK